MVSSPTKTICFFNSNRAWGGGEKWHFTTCKEFQLRGFKTFLVTNVHSELSKKAMAQGLNVFSFYVHNLSFLNPFKILTLVSLFRSEKVDAVVMNLPSDLKVAGLAAKIAGVKKIIYRRGMPHPLRNTWLNRYLFKNVLTHVVVNSQEIGRSLQAGNENWFPENKVVLVYNGVDSTKKISSSHKIHEKKENEIIIGNAGRLTEQKGQKYLLEMAEILKNDGIKFKLLIAGEGELKDELQRKIRELDLEEEVILMGHVSDMTGFFNSLDVFVFTSLYEGSANTLIETLQHQVPTVCFDISSNPEIILHQETGILVKPFEVEGLALAVKELYEKKDHTALIKEKGFSLVKERFDSARNLNILQDIL
jgi:glycosyltransferase involved in cell wall biosynthesis